ncbi:hypothetical protein P280DRAFT_238840 [Massarina eburnea CBS 473.64]|uniref:Uncharacterized protein n=1 Tax=Massarina eburnea CBS 473.64 TaxID=1395130 RepID=A0A6A6RHI1_9PLEO|nr:hypothetical protein P280DRAFT_238840 [Massarina eburnea CBS 473.64]
MELPAEVRLIIAEHALYYEDGLEWRWKSYSKERKVGTFYEDSESTSMTANLNPLALVCKKLHHETKNIVFKVNVLGFSSIAMDVGIPDNELYDDSIENDFENPMEAWDHFREHADDLTLAAVRQVKISCCILWPEHPCSDPVMQRRLSQLEIAAVGTPHAHFVLDPSWELYPAEKEDTEDVAHFLEEGDLIEASVWKHSLTNKRTWRVRVSYTSEKHVARVREYVPESRQEKALSWLENGI